MPFNIAEKKQVASGEKMQFRGLGLWRFEGDKIAERWATVTPPAGGRREPKDTVDLKVRAVSR